MSDTQVKAPLEEATEDAQLGKQGDTDGLGPPEEADPEDAYDDTDYIPDFIQELLDDPPVLPSESEDAFVCLFESFEFGYTQRPKTDLEYSWVFWATASMWELMRYERMKAAIVGLERHVAVEILHRQVSTEAVGDSGFSAMRKLARENARLFFTDPNYRKNFLETLKRTGFGASAIDAMALERALPSLNAINRLIKAAEKRLADCLKRLDLAYASREPEDPMPRSSAASRADDMRKKQVEELKKERNRDQCKAVGCEQA